MAFFTLPEEQEVIVRGRALTGSQQLDPLGDWPVVFSCKYRGADSIGCVFLNGAIMVMPNQCSYDVGPIVLANWAAVEQSSEITEVIFEWQVTRTPRDADLHIVQPPAQDDPSHEILKLREIVTKLPTTADGVPVAPGDTVFSFDENARIIQTQVCEDYLLADVPSTEDPENDDWFRGNVKGCYSSRQAAWKIAQEDHDEEAQRPPQNDQAVQEAGRGAEVGD
jgi:hypothetical protein